MNKNMFYYLGKIYGFVYFRVRYFLRSLRSHRISEQASIDFRDDLVISEVQRVLCGSSLEPGSNQDNAFWEDMASKIEVPYGSNLRQEVAKFFRAKQGLREAYERETTKG